MTIEDYDEWLKPTDRPLTGLNKIEIKAPIWATRSVGIAEYRLRPHNLIEIMYTKKDGTRYDSNKYYITEEKARTYPIQIVGGRVKLFLVPISDLEEL